MQQGRRIAGMAGVSVLAIVLAACGGGGGGKSTSGTTASGGKPVRGGIINAVGESDVDHLDTASGYYTVSYEVFRGITRQLLQYPASTDNKTATTPVADVATDVPKPTNGGKTYTFHIKQGVKWDTNPPRQVTSKDFARGIKRLCNPVEPSGGIAYYTGTIVGMSAFCDKFAKVKGDVASIKQFVESNDIPGIKTPNDSTIEFDLMEPAGDFPNMMAMTFASAVPVEMLNYLPDSPEYRTHFISDGPYKLASYVPDKEIKFVRNPAWDPKTDTLRKAYVDGMTVNGLGAQQQTVQQQLEAGTIDWGWAHTVPTARIPALKAQKNTQLGLFPDGSLTYMVFNLLSPNNNGALKNVKVRQAINIAFNKKSVQQVRGGPDVQQIAEDIISPPVDGYDPSYKPYAANNGAGDPAKAKKMLADAGYPNGLTLKIVYRTSLWHPATTTAVQNDLKAAGITLKLTPASPSDFYAKYLEVPSAAKKGVWDVAIPGWIPDWFGDAGRTFFEPLFNGTSYGPNSTDYGDYNNPAANDAMKKAEQASPSQAAGMWRKVDEMVMKDAPIVPIVFGKQILYRGKAIRNAIFSPFLDDFDWTNVWLQR